MSLVSWEPLLGPHFLEWSQRRLLEDKSSALSIGGGEKMVGRHSRPSWSHAESDVLDIKVMLENGRGAWKGS